MFGCADKYWEGANLVSNLAKNGWILLTTRTPVSRFTRGKVSDAKRRLVWGWGRGFTNEFTMFRLCKSCWTISCPCSAKLHKATAKHDEILLRTCWCMVSHATTLVSSFVVCYFEALKFIEVQHGTVSWTIVTETSNLQEDMIFLENPWFLCELLEMFELM